MKKLKGMGVALITPFDNGEVDFEALKKIVRFQIDNGTDYLVVLGTTGEYITLTDEERERVKETVKTENDGGIPLVLGIGGNNTAAVKHQLQTEDCSGFDAILSVSPAYNKPSQEGMYRHFKSLSSVTPLPLILYNVPGRTGSNMQPETVARLAADCDQIIGIKEAAGDLGQAMKIIAQTPEDFLVISGDDMLALPMVLAGGAGVISVIGEGFPAEFSRMIALGLQGETTEAYRLHYRLSPAIDLIFAEGNPSGIKAVFEKRGLATDQVRLPLVPASEELKEKVAQFIGDLYH